VASSGLGEKWWDYVIMIATYALLVDKGGIQFYCKGRTQVLCYCLFGVVAKNLSM
jgi:hypothetical protein